MASCSKPTKSSVAKAARASRVFDQEPQLAQILFAPTQTHRRRERHGHETCILAGKKQNDEFGARFGDQCNAIATIDACQSKQTSSSVHRLRAQLSIAQLTYDFTAPVEERHRMTASGRVIQRFMQRREVSWSPNWVVYSAIRIRLKGSPVYHQHTLELIMIEFANTQTKPRKQLHTLRPHST